MTDPLQFNAPFPDAPSRSPRALAIALLGGLAVWACIGWWVLA